MKYNEDNIPWNTQRRIWNDSRPIHELSKKLAIRYHVSTRDIVSKYMPYVLLVLGNNPNLKMKVREYLNLDHSEFRVMENEIQKITESVKN